MSCNREVPGDYELPEVVEAAETDWNGISEDEGGIIIDGPGLSCNASRLEPGSDRVEVWLVDARQPPTARRSLTGWLPRRTEPHTHIGRKEP